MHICARGCSRPPDTVGQRPFTPSAICELSAVRSTPESFPSKSPSLKLGRQSIRREPRQTWNWKNGCSNLAAKWLDSAIYTPQQGPSNSCDSGKARPRTRADEARTFFSLRLIQKSLVRSIRHTESDGG